ncbi:sigma-70 family RNA polymerase sigma factor [Pedobacter hiemivivus]|uniref:Sigma-70 family RNA polymerase sigma factor n=1 Tax=Pedobacter hiemivivus TaxID=2530454 RepID=A0A4U1GE89_9SPHI|nr:MULTISPECIES: sigma-70 family RNA polymerase sigma factor [Pedobacter]TCC86707.1 sigma-70 family RNA polymerase sigma factor [Pedobacter hiemivivus]TKC62238.1 sigma-70 family RNA polymerase sigma factor [Pedobacter hiemivivus]SDK09564.1 RNA polymerase sigma-70 factor, ECF subfamily [Pedobacter sp. ok626]
MERHQKKVEELNFETLEVLFRKNHKFLCMIAVNHVKDPFIAEDIVQEFFINFWERQDKIKLHTSFEAYACRSIKYKSISWLRSQETVIKRISEYDYPSYEDPMEAAFKAADEEGLELKILKLIDELPTERKRILLLSTTGNYTYAQIAEMLGISINTVKSQMVKAYASLRLKAGPILFSMILNYLLLGV